MLNDKSYHENVTFILLQFEMNLTCLVSAVSFLVDTNIDLIGGCVVGGLFALVIIIAIVIGCSNNDKDKKRKWKTRNKGEYMYLRSIQSLTVIA